MLNDHTYPVAVYLCKKCNRSLGISMFHKDTTTKGHYSVCKDCRSGDHQNVMTNLMSNARKRAEKSGLPFAITRDDVKALNDAQSGRCAYTGLPLNWKAGGGRKQRVCPPDRASLDRIDSKKGYVPGNVQLLTDFANRIKAWHLEKDFIQFCFQVVDYLKR